MTAQDERTWSQVAGHRGGRIDLVTFVVATGAASGEREWDADSRRLLAAARQPQSVVELCARLRLSPASVMMIVSTLVDEGALEVLTSECHSGRPALQTMQDVLQGLRRL